MGEKEKRVALFLGLQAMHLGSHLFLPSSLPASSPWRELVGFGIIWELRVSQWLRAASDRGMRMSLGHKVTAFPGGCLPALPWLTASRCSRALRKQEIPRKPPRSFPSLQMTITLFAFAWQREDPCSYPMPWPRRGAHVMAVAGVVWCLPSSPPASLLAGCSILGSASGSSMSAGSTGEAASSIGESCWNPIAFPWRRSSGRWEWGPRKCPQRQMSLVVGRKMRRKSVRVIGEVFCC